MIELVKSAVMQAADLGGPVVLVLIATSIATVAVIFYKLWQFLRAGVGRHKALREAVTAWDAGDRAAARAALGRSKSYLAPVIDMGFSGQADDLDRLRSEAEARFARLERGFRFLDTVSQLAPLLGLFGTVLGMIQAFQALQEAGSQVDPSILAGGIWVALLTTAVGLAVAMPTSMVLSWFESRMDAERVIADHAILSVLHPQGREATAASAERPVAGQARHA
ncbi:MotA/TolQ/ExbB proton channel family protein [Roseovarius sp. CH_XMU1461]|jgi:biopolymer transport protein ExbB|uniref:MotA/TolQ/ExbB proton channel family protein n=1 Tax=Roseovarius sp. CH_XMU1461 TaxID=3107777 RepID=UPI0030086E92